MNKINYIFDFELSICILNTMEKTSIERNQTMFKNINLKKLTRSELDLLLRLVDLYASEFNNEVISDELKEKLNQYGDEVCTEIGARS